MEGILWEKKFLQGSSVSKIYLLPLLMHYLDVLPKVVCVALLWRDIEKSGEWVACRKVLQETLPFIVRCCAIDGSRRYVSCPQCVYLIGLEWSVRGFRSPAKAVRTINESRGEMTIVTRILSIYQALSVK